MSILPAGSRDGQKVRAKLRLDSDGDRDGSVQPRKPLSGSSIIGNAMKSQTETGKSQVRFTHEVAKVC
jgi:hypothetical protein